MEEQVQTIDIQLDHPEEAIAIFGTNDNFLKRIEEELQAKIVTRGENIHITGKQKDIHLVRDILNTLMTVINKGITISERDVRSEEHTSELQSRFDLVCRLL